VFSQNYHSIFTNTNIGLYKRLNIYLLDWPNVISFPLLRLLPCKRAVFLLESVPSYKLPLQNPLPYLTIPHASKLPSQPGHLHCWESIIVRPKLKAPSFFHTVGHHKYWFRNMFCKWLIIPSIYSFITKEQNIFKDLLWVN
jgi:hypothetical protein